MKLCGFFSYCSPEPDEELEGETLREVRGKRPKKERERKNRRKKKQTKETKAKEANG